ncbi:DUF1183-domain-containing protein [Cystobasidium minutum MCA 4210]|uniref:DUF1183-domain-containing protein n=1 Tax=Cystobasidium minutum MCA 4210 TaxID=1397322 RepID=UPI0034CD4BD4|eukprot:jgi/Rhomi1/147209/e_gw1.8.412.1
MAYGTRSSRVRMDSIDTLTFYNGELTAARRSSPVPQLECVGKPCKLYQPDVVQCTAVGRNGPDTEWKCQAELPSSIRFGRVQVSCEGYDSPDDPFILKGVWRHYRKLIRREID